MYGLATIPSEPFNNVLAAIADVGDNQRLMGSEWTEQHLAGIAFIIGKGMISKTYMQGLEQLTDVLGNDPRKLEKIAGNLANNTIPLSSLRNEIGRLLNPQMRELNSGMMEQIRNRNLMFEGLTDDQLPMKYDILNGKAINDWHPLTRMFNFFSPVQLNFDPLLDVKCFCVATMICECQCTLHLTARLWLRMPRSVRFSKRLLVSRT